MSGDLRLRLLFWWPGLLPCNYFRCLERLFLFR